jgi:hypothetical protein
MALIRAFGMLYEEFVMTPKLEDKLAGEITKRCVFSFPSASSGDPPTRHVVTFHDTQRSLGSSPKPEVHVAAGIAAR